jgi:hypothetical protein
LFQASVLQVEYVCCGPAPSFHGEVPARCGTHGRKFVPGEAQTRNCAAVSFHPRFVEVSSRMQIHTDQRGGWSPCPFAKTAMAILNWYSTVTNMQRRSHGTVVPPRGENRWALRHVCSHPMPSTPGTRRSYRRCSILIPEQRYIPAY